MAGDAANDILRILAEKAITPIVNSIIRQFGYLFFYNRNIKNLKERVAQLEESLKDTNLYFDSKIRNNEERAHSSAGWLKKVGEVTMAANKVVKDKDISKGWCVNLKDRYVLSRKSTKIAIVIQVLQKQAPKLGATKPALPAAMLHGSSYNDASKDFKTRTKVMDKVMEALKDDKMDIVGICGLGGIGKTTILKEVCERARTQKLFDEVAMIIVSQDQNIFNIQRDLATTLGLKIMSDEMNIFARAKHLHTRLTNGRKILVVLDDVWSAIELKDVGIPVGNDRAKTKVVLASRYKSVCTSMGALETITVEELSKEEAWHLFKKIAGDCVVKKKLEKISEEVANECGGLPIALVTLAKALSNKNKGVWEDALTQLRQSNVTRIPGMNKVVYPSIKLSFDFLASELPEAQSFLLICCQHAEDAEIKVEKLAKYCLALQLFNNVEKFVDVRNRTYAVIDYLSSCFLLQVVDVDEEENYERVKMHDVIRDVCLSILSEMKEERDKVYMHIMVPDTSGDYELDNNKVNYSKLKILVKAPLANKVLDVSFLQQMKELRVFINCRRYRSNLPPDFRLLKSLRMLSLEMKPLSKEIMSSIEILSGLEILSFWRSKIMSFPQIGQLKNLKLLDLRCEEGKGFIPRGILLGLKELEVLCMGNFLLLGETKIKDIQNGEIHGRITELDSLSNLTTLQINLFDPNDLLDLQYFCFKKLEIFFWGSYGFGVGESGYRGYQDKCRLRKLVQKTIRLEHFVGMDWVLEAKIQCIVTTTVNLELRRVQNWTDPCILEKFVSVRKLVLYYCDQLEYALPGRSLGELQRLELENLPMMTQLWVVPTDLMCLGNLREVEISFCESIRNIFPHAAAEFLVQLEELRIIRCPVLKGIVSNGEPGITAAEIKEEPPIDFIVMFPKLRILVLHDLPELEVFYNLQQHEAGTVQQAFLNPSVILPSIEELQCQYMNKVKQFVGGGMQELSKLSAAGCLENLKEISVLFCDSMEIIVDFGENAHGPTFNELKAILLRGLPKLEHLCGQVPQQIRIFRNLKDLRVDNCNNLGYLISSSLAHMLVKLEILEVRECHAMKEVIQVDEDCAVKKIVFPSLNSLELYHLQNLSSFCSDDRQSIEFPVLEEVLIEICTKMKTFCCGYLTTEKLHGVKPSDGYEVELVWKGDLNQTVGHLNSRVNPMESDVEEDDDFEEVITADEHTNEGTPEEASMPLSVVEEDDDFEESSSDECTNEGTPEKASMPLSVVSSPDASLTSDIVSSPPVSDNNEDLVGSLSSPDLRRVALSPLVEFAPSASMEPKSDHKELSDMSFSSPDDDHWKRNRILIQGVYVKSKLKTTFEEILMAKPNFLSGLRLKLSRLKTEVIESAIRSLEILRQRTALTISLEELAYIKDSLDDLESIGLDTTWLERGYKRAMLVILKEQKVVSAAEELATLEREKMKDEVAFEMAKEKLEASTARRDCFKAEYGALMQELEAGKHLFGDGFDSNTSLGDGLLD